MRLIDADALKENAREWIPPYNASVVINLFDLIDNLVDNLPTIDPVKHGKWIRTSGKTKEGRYYEVCHCSVCGGEAKAGACYYDNETAYCPNCGAQMERSEDETN